jgi:hypothetical protein
MDRLGYKKTLLSGWPASQEADLQGCEIHLRPLPRHRTLPGADPYMYYIFKFDCYQGWKKPGFLKKKPAQWVFLGFLGFWGFFGVFCPEERVLGFFSVSRILLGASRL